MSRYFKKYCLVLVCALSCCTAQQAFSSQASQSLKNFFSAAKKSLVQVCNKTYNSFLVPMGKEIAVHPVITAALAATILAVSSIIAYKFVKTRLNDGFSISHPDSSFSWLEKRIEYHKQNLDKLEKSSQTKGFSKSMENRITNEKEEVSKIQQHLDGLKYFSNDSSEEEIENGYTANFAKTELEKNILGVHEYLQIAPDSSYQQFMEQYFQKSNEIKKMSSEEDRAKKEKTNRQILYVTATHWHYRFYAAYCNKTQSKLQRGRFSSENLTLPTEQAAQLKFSYGELLKKCNSQDIP